MAIVVRSAVAATLNLSPVSPISRVERRQPSSRSSSVGPSCSGTAVATASRRGGRWTTTPSGPAELDDARAARALEPVGQGRVAGRDDDLAPLDRAQHAHQGVEPVRVPVGEQLVEEQRQPRLGVDRIDQRQPHGDVDLLERAARERRADAQGHGLARARDLQHGLARRRLDDRDAGVAAVGDRLEVAGSPPAARPGA